MKLVFYNKLFVLFVVSNCLFLTVSSQYFISSDLHENLYIYNPARITQVKGIQVQGMYRNPYPWTNDYVNYNGAFIVNSEDLKSTVGVSVFRDVEGEGIISYTNFALQYGFKTKLARFWDFAAGIEFSYSLYRTDFLGLNFGTLPPPNLTNDANNYFDFSAGIELTYQEKTRYGLSFSKFGTLLQGLGQLQQPGLNMYYETTIRIKNIGLSSKAALVPLANVSLYQNNSVLHYGSRLDLGNVLAGIYLRQNLRFDFDAFIILLGTRFGNSSLFYTYDINLSGVGAAFTNLAAHEVTFLYNMEYNRKSKRKGAIKCPKI